MIEYKIMKEAKDNIVKKSDYVCQDCGTKCHPHRAHLIKGTDKTCYMVQDKRGGIRQLGVYDG